VEDPFKEEGEGAVKEEDEEEAWLKSDRDYTYEEVSQPLCLSLIIAITSCVPNSP